MIDRFSCIGLTLPASIIIIEKTFSTIKIINTMVIDILINGQWVCILSILSATPLGNLTFIATENQVQLRCRGSLSCRRGSFGYLKKIILFLNSLVCIYIELLQIINMYLKQVIVRF